MVNIAVIGGDGIGPEVTAEAIKAIEAVRDDAQFTHFDLGAEHYLRTGDILPESELEELATYDAILLGAVGAPGKVAPGILERGLLLELRFRFDHHVNLRPVRLFPGPAAKTASPLAGVSPADVDFVVVREGTEGLYAGNGGVLRKGTPQEVASEVSQNTRFGVERVVRDAFRRADKRRADGRRADGGRGRLTLVHKTNVLVHAGSLWQRTVDEVAPEFPNVDVDYVHIDAATIYMVTEPSRFDVIVTDNLFGDILTDLAGAVAGGIGLAASGNIDTSRTYPSMFEPVHGSAPDIAGKNIADPTAAILSAALMLRHLGDEEGARAIEDAVAADVAERPVNAAGEPDSTTDVGERIVKRIADTHAGEKSTVRLQE